MTIYQAPVRDICFVVEELIGLDTIAALPGFEAATPELFGAALGETARLGEAVIAPTNRLGDVEGCRLENGRVVTPAGYPEAYKAFVEGGWNAVAGDPANGGQGLPWLIATALSEVWQSANMALGLCPMLTQAAAEAVSVHASDEIKEIYLAKLVSGEWTGTLEMTEPQAGTDLGAIRTRATKDGEGYRLKGQKTFITWGEHDLTPNIIHLVLARSPQGPPGIRGLSLYVVPKFIPGPDGGLGPRNDLKCVSLERKLGIHGSPTAVLAYGDDEGARAYLIGVENQGIQAIFTMMNHARLGVGLQALAIAERAYQQARDYARTRVQGRDLGRDGDHPKDDAGGEAVTILHHPDVRRMVLTMKANIEAMRALVHSTAASADIARRHADDATREAHAGRADLMTPVVKA